MSTANKLTYLNGTKQAIKNAINEDFEVIDNNTTFREYADKISSNNAKYKDLIPKETTNATNTLDISNSAGIEKALVTQYGNTYQETTTGKNLYYITPQTKNGITLSYDNDGAIVLNGTSTAGFTAFIQDVSLNGTFSLSTNNAVTQENTYVRTRNSNGTLVHSITLNNTSGIVTKTSEIATLEITIGASGITFNNYKIYVQLEQGSTATSYEPYTNGASPNPDYPQEIVNISGKSNVKVVGKNLFDVSQVQIGVAWNNTSNSARAVVYAKCEPNTKYTISFNNISNFDGIFNFEKVSTTSATATSSVSSLTSTKTITTTSTSQYIGIQFNKSDISLNDFDGLKLQVEKGSTATTYEPYIGNTYPLYLGVENLFDGVFRQGNRYSTGLSNTTRLFTTQNYQVKSGVSYTISTSLDTSIYRYAINLSAIEWPIAGGTSYYYDSGWIYARSFTFTPTQDGYLGITVSKTNGTDSLTPNDIANYTWQLEKGSKANHYTPYGTTPIELCKIGDYKDRIYYSSGNWYLEKNIEKIILNGTQTINQINTNQTNTTRVMYQNFVNGKTSSIDLYCSHLLGVINWNVDTEGMYINNTDLVFRMNKTTIGTTETTINNWLSSNNVTLYYLLATPTTEEITESNYPTLYNQLNNIKLYEGVNHITMTNESGLDVEFDIEYYKDWKLD